MVSVVTGKRNDSLEDCVFEGFEYTTIVQTLWVVFALINYTCMCIYMYMYMYI